MKQLITLLLSVFIAGISLAQVPQQIKYQAVARDASGDPMANESINLQISILPGNAEATAIFTEQHALTTSAQGLLAVDIGTGTPVTGTFDAIDWSAGPYFLKVALNGTLMGTSQLVSVPYALHAKTATQAEEYDETDPLYAASLASGITAADTAYWNQKQEAGEGASQAQADSLQQLIEDLQLGAGQQFITDYDGNTYPVVQIGQQIWMAKNMRTTHYADGSPIPLIEDNGDWGNLIANSTSDAYCFYNNNVSGVYGALYTWAAATNRSGSSTDNPSGIQGICPDGWHLPSRAEWQELKTYLKLHGYENVEGGALKATYSWESGGSGSNDFGFAATATGYRAITSGEFTNQQTYVYYWTATQDGEEEAYFYYLATDHEELKALSNKKSFGFSVRCVKD